MAMDGFHQASHPSSIYCVSHKPGRYPAVPGIKLLQTGDKGVIFSDILDSIGNNIASRNPYYSELTGFYQIWKNHPSPLVGFCHYRRYLLPPSFSDWIRREAVKPQESGFLVKQDNFIAEIERAPDIYSQEMFGLLNSADILLPRSQQLPPGGFIRQYESVHPIAPLLRMVAVLAEADNDIGISLYNYLTNARHAHWNNLFVTRWEVFDGFCRSLFPLMKRLEKEIQLPASGYQQRVFAFLSERLFNFWVWHTQLKVLELDWCLIDEHMATIESHHWQRQ